MVAGLALSAIVLSVSSADSATLRVPAQYSSIGAALDASGPGDRVLVGAGTYFENLNLPGGVVLESESGAETTIIDGSSSGSVIQCSGISGAVVRGFTLRNGFAGLGGGFSAYQSSVLFEENIVRGNRALGGPSYGGGVYTQLCPPSMIVRRNFITDNTASIGGGICCNGGDSATIEGNTIWNNHAEFASGIISYNDSDIRIEGNIIAENNGGKGLWVHSNSLATVLCNDVWSNTPVNYHGDDQTGLNGNISEDPLFCDRDSEDLRLSNDSPCAPGNHPNGDDCGWMGYIEQSCGPLAGACCFDATECIVVLENICEAAEDGLFLGEGVPCSPGSCPPAGACCLATGECVQTSGTNCSAVDGEFFVDVSCLPNPCPVPVGACCYSGECVILSGPACAGGGGSFLGEGSVCEDCNPADVSGNAPAQSLISLPFPNPSGGDLRLFFQLAAESDYDLGLYRVDGRRVRAWSGRLGASRTELILAGGTEEESLPTGRFFLRGRVGSQDVRYAVTVVR